MQEADIVLRIQELCHARGWSIYRLAKESGITYSTLCTMLHKANYPSISTLLKLCEGFGITLADFFDSGNRAAALSQAQISHLAQWSQLSQENKAAADKYIRYLLQEQADQP